MGSGRFARLRELLLAVADLGEAERAAYLEEACKDDPELRREVESVLAHENDATGVMKTAGAAPPRDSHPDTIGPYKILEPIGEGGMGVVYLAEQTEPVRRRVALKVIKAGMDSKQVVARFESERQALALMDHPAIAKVLDAGTTPEGRPYFAMDFCPGVPITEYCDRRRLGVRERLTLFQQICEGVQHAHQKALIHRDLKPSNILVADVDGKPQPRIIDFGVAKATTQKLTEKTMYTAMGQLIGTPEYMSPEQADLTVEDVDTRTDVYSLGVILYELLAGALPFDSTQLRQAGFEGIIRLLREKDPMRPSTKVSSLGEQTSEIAQRRRSEPRRLAGELKGDLDWIVMRSMEKDRNRRYGSPQELAQDIQRHLDNEPVLAGPPSATYRARKFVKRNRIAVGFATTIILAVAVGFILLTVQNAKIAAARDEAEAIVTTLEDMLASVDPTKSGRDVTVKEMLDETAQTVGEKFKDRPLIEARLRYTIGYTYYSLGEYDIAERHLLRALEIHGEQAGQESPGALEAMNMLARTYHKQGRYSEAEVLAGENLKIMPRILGREHPQTLRAMITLSEAWDSQGRSIEAERLARETLEISTRALGDENPQTLRIKNYVGVLSLNQGRYEEAEVLLQETLEGQCRLLGKENQNTLSTMNNVALVHMKQGRYDEAEPLLRETVDIMRRVNGEAHRWTLVATKNLVETYMRQGRFDEAEQLACEKLDTCRRVYGEESPETLGSMRILAYCYSFQGRYDESEALLRETLEINRRAHGNSHRDMNDVRYDLACALALQGRRSEAISVLQDAVDNGFEGTTAQGSSIGDDPDLASLHGDPEFEEIVEELKRRNEEVEPAAVEEHGSVERQ